ncbi:MAG: hypothetical protein IJL06_00835 [Kiritimatiellae bacterium]|nr:hypothetical protein [Kiritimatiellia bacterium]
MEPKRPEERPVPFGGLLTTAGRAVHPLERLARRVLGRDGDLKVLAVLAAVVVYVLVEPVSAGISRTVSVPVHVLPEGGTTAIVGVKPAAVAVTLRGSAEDFTAFDADSMRVELRPSTNQLSVVPDVDPLGVTNQLSAVLSVGPQDVTNAPGRLRVAAVSPASVEVEYDYMSKMPVYLARPRTSGLPVQGTAVASFPTNLELTAFGSVKKLSAFGAKKILLPTDPVDVKGKTESFDTTVAVRPPEDSGIERVEPAEVPVHVEIRIRVAPGAEDIHVSAPVLLKPEDAEAKQPGAKTAEPDSGEPAGEPPSEAPGPDPDAGGSAPAAETEGE